MPLHAQAAAFAEHCGFSIDVLAAYRPTGKGGVEHHGFVACEYVLAEREFNTPRWWRGDEPADHGIGRSRGGLSTKAHVLVDGRGRPGSQ